MAPIVPGAGREIERPDGRAGVHLGIGGAMRFLMQYDPGWGDYTKERKAILEGLSFEETARAMREAGSSASS